MLIADLKTDPTTSYARAVVAGGIIAGKYVKLACQRHLTDLETARERGFYFDHEAAQLAFDFIGLLRHSKGEWSGQPFALEPWQMFFVGCMFGWKRADGRRRFRIAHLEVARKNGKSTLAAAIMLALMVLDQEPGAELYNCATKEKQARITFEESVAMRDRSSSLHRMIEKYHSNLSIPATRTKYEPLGADSQTLDGLNVHAASMDELHAWTSRKLWDVIETATGSRREPMLLVTTTAGYDRHSIWWERRELAIKVLEGIFQDDRLFACIYTLDDADEWTDETTWIKANPSLGVSVKIEDLRAECKEAQQTPGKQNGFIRLKLNRPTEQADRWLDLAEWDACAEPIDEAELVGRECYGGLDLAQTLDLAAWVLWFPPTEEGERHKFIGRFFLPKDRMRQRVERDRVPYDQWAAEGSLILTPGNVIDYAAIEAQVLKDAGCYRIKELAFDRMFALPIIQRLQNEGLDCVAFGQGFVSMAAPTKEFGKMIAARELAHPGTAIWRWQAGNVAVKTDPAGNLKPDKEASTEKIDGIVAAVMALGRVLVNGTVESGPQFFFSE